MTPRYEPTMDEIAQRIRRSEAEAQRWPHSPAAQTVDFLKGQLAEAQVDCLIRLMEAGKVEPVGSEYDL